MRHFRPTALKAALAAVMTAFSVVSIAEAQITGVPLRDGADCGMQYYDRSMTGAMFIKAGPGQSGSYRLTVRRGNDSNDVLLRMAGDFTGHRDRETLIARAYLMSRTAAHPSDFIEMHRAQTVRQGREIYRLNGVLQIFDRYGNLTCRTNQVELVQSHAGIAGPVSRPPVNLGWVGSRQ